MNFWIRLFTALNVFIYHISRGHLGDQLGKHSILLLYTIGRKSGKRYATSISYYRDGENYVVVGSNWGKENHPGWFYNLMQQPLTTIQVGTNTIAVEARVAQGDEYQRLWELVTPQNHQLARYQKKITRRLPVVILTPTR